MRASELIEVRTRELDPIDRSDLYLVYMRVKPGGGTRDYLLANWEIRSDNEYAVVDSVHEVYGHDDLIVKVRSSGDRFLSDKMLDPVRKAGHTNGGQWYTMINVRREEYARDKRTRDIWLEANDETRGMTAFVRFPELEHPDIVIKWLWRKVQTRSESAQNCSILMTGAFTGRGADVVTEYFVPCGGFYSLAEIIKQIERYIKEDLELHLNIVTSIVWASHGPIRANPRHIESLQHA
jgi:hypothetical protein